MAKRKPDKPNRKPTVSRARKRRLRQNQSSHLNFEALEARQPLAGVTVGNALDVVNADVTSITALIANDGFFAPESCSGIPTGYVDYRFDRQ